MQKYLIPPTCLEVEKHVVGAILLDPDALHTISSLLAPSDFFLEKHLLVYQAAVSLSLRGVQPDFLTILEELRRTGDMQNVGDDYLREVSVEVVSSANLKAHAEIIREYSVRRALHHEHYKAAEELQRGEFPLKEQLTRIDNSLSAISCRQHGEFGFRIVPSEEWRAEAAEAYDGITNPYLSTGWKNMDEFFKLGSGQLHIVTGIPNHGKSEWLDALLVNAVTEHGHRIAYFSPENFPLKRHVRKLAEKLAGKPLFGFGRMSRHEYEQTLAAMAKYFSFSDQGKNGANFDQVLAEFSRINPRPNHAVIDPWNRLETQRSREKTETEFVKDCLARGLRFAQATGINLWIVAHPQKLYKNKDTGKISLPGLYDISGSAHWANMTDNAFTVWRDFEKKQTDVHALKVRFKDQGSPGMASFAYQWEAGRYIPWQYHQDAQKMKQVQAGNRATGLPKEDW